MTFQQTIQTARQLGRAPNSPEVQAAARAEILRQQQIQQAQSAIQQQQSAEQQRRAAANAAELVKAVDTGDADKVTWTKPAAKPTAAAPATTPQAVPKTLQVNPTIKIEPQKAVLQKQSKTDSIGNLDATFGSYSPQAKLIAEGVGKTGNPVEQGLATAYLWNDDPKNVGSAAWYEKEVGKKFGVNDLKEQIKTGNPVIDILANAGQTVVRAPADFSRLVTSSGISLVGIGREAAAGDLDEAIRGTIESGVANSLINTGQTAVENPGALLGSIAVGAVMGGGLKAVSPKITVPKTQTIKAPGITIKNKTITIESPLGKTTTINKVKETKAPTTAGSPAGTMKATIVSTDKGTTAAIQKGVIKTDTGTVKRGNLQIDTGKRQLTVQKTAGTRTAVKNETVDILGRNGEIITQKKSGKATQKVSGVKVTATKTKKGTTTTKRTAQKKATATENIRISQTVNGQTRNAARRTRRTETRYAAERDGEILKTSRKGKVVKTGKTDNPTTGKKQTIREIRTATEKTNPARVKQQAQRTARKNAKADAQKARRENSDRAREEAYAARAQEIKIQNLIKRYGRKRGMEEAVKRGYVIRPGKTNGKTAATKPAQPKQSAPKQTAPKSGTPTGTAKPSGNGMVMMQKPKTGQKQTQGKKTRPATVIITGAAVKRQGVTTRLPGTTQQKTKIRVTVKPDGNVTRQTQTTQTAPQKVKPQPQETPTPAGRTLTITATAETTKPKTDTKEKQKLVVMPAVAPAVRQTQTTTRKQKPAQDEVLKKAVAVRQQTKKRVLIKTEEVKRKKNKKAPKKGKNAVRLETVNQFGWLGFDAKPPAKPKLLKLQ